MKSFILNTAIYSLLFLSTLGAVAQEQAKKKVVITGVRFTYPLLEKWIAEFRETNPDTEVIIESRTTVDPSKYDLLIEAYEPEKSVKETRDYLYLARYALLPIGNSSSAFVKAFSDKGLTSDLIRQIYFHDILADRSQDKRLALSHTVYTRLQKAGAPITFAKFYGYDQQNIKGKAIAGSDEHLLKALQKDSTAISYSTPAILFDPQSRNLAAGISIIPLDLDGNKKVTENEKIFSTLDTTIKGLEEEDIKNIPVGDLHISINKINENPDALKFLLWILYHGQDDLHHFGYLKPDQKRFDEEKEKFEQRALK